MADSKKGGQSFVPFYECGAQIYMSLKLSKDGLSREEDTETIKGMYDDDRARNTGWKVRQRVFGRKGEDNNADGPGPQ